ncbi:MAG TPA: hypothetical protein GX510_07685 [Firmicutes bacterium]|nr:hypothetical protein [Candidatus Fermentithermobacillaceae bacterium]
MLAQLDTGASNTILYRQVLDRLGVRYELGKLDSSDPRGVVEDDALACPHFRLKATSWGRLVYLLHMGTDPSLQAAGATFPLEMLSGSELVDKLEETLGVNAIAGNALFADVRVYVGFRGKAMVIVPSR